MALPEFAACLSGKSGGASAASPKQKPAAKASPKAEPKKEAKKEKEPKKEAKKAEPKAEPKAKASPKAAPAAAPGGGGNDEAIQKLGDEIRELKAKLKAQGLKGKEIDKNEEVAAKVEKLKELKAGGGAAAASPAAKGKASPKAAAAPAPAADDRAKRLKKVVKEGGKRGVEIEGAADMGGLKFFCTSVDE